jgi:hypothetical protein
MTARRTVVLEVVVDVDHDNIKPNLNPNLGSTPERPIRYIAALDEKNNVLHTEQLPEALLNRLTSLDRGESSSTPFISVEKGSSSGSSRPARQSTRGIAKRVKSGDRRQILTSNPDPGPATEEKYEIEDILDQREVAGKLELLVKWNGYPEPDWNSRNLMLIDAPESVADFDARRQLAQENLMTRVESLTRHLEIDTATQDKSYAPSEASSDSEDFNVGGEEVEAEESEDDDIPFPTRRNARSPTSNQGSASSVAFEDALSVQPAVSPVIAQLPSSSARDVSPAMDSFFGTPEPTVSFINPTSKRASRSLFMTPNPASDQELTELPPNAIVTTTGLGWSVPPTTKRVVIPGQRAGASSSAAKRKSRAPSLRLEKKAKVGPPARETLTRGAKKVAFWGPEGPRRKE